MFSRLIIRTIAVSTLGSFGSFGPFCPFVPFTLSSANGAGPQKSKVFGKIAREQLWAALRTSKTVGQFFAQMKPRLEKKDLDFLNSRLSAEDFAVSVKATKQSENSFVIEIGGEKSTFKIVNSSEKETKFEVDGKTLRVTAVSTLEQVVKDLEKGLSGKSTSLRYFLETPAYGIVQALAYIFYGGLALQLVRNGLCEFLEGLTNDCEAGKANAVASWINSRPTILYCHDDSGDSVEDRLSRCVQKSTTTIKGKEKTGVK
ncbi:MAG: hypothetical protein C5B49_10480 [Bdellovibrio sp.]|nr:MAG: hypothetical protein C5B49_10480 [Bdellovibrio sp.]